MESLKSKFRGCLVGSAIGDFLGAGERRYTDDTAMTRYTDDTAMTIGVAESLIESKGFDGENMAKIFLKNYQAEPWRGYGPGPAQIFEMIKSGRDWNENLDRELYPEGSFGNGAAMRVAPIGLFYCDELIKLREVSYQSSRITHSHPLGMEGAALQAFAVSLAVNIESQKLDEYDFLKNLIDFVEIELYREKLKEVEKLLEKAATKIEVIRTLGNTVEAINSVPIAIYSFLANPNFKLALKLALNLGLGEDRNTISAMTGAIAGACYGIDEIPKEWRSGLENKDYIEKLAKELWEIKMEGQRKKRPILP